MPRSRRGFLGWMVAAAAAVLVAGSFEVARSSVFSHPELRSEHAQPGAGVPPDMMVVVSTTERYFTRRLPVHPRQSTHSDTHGPGSAMREGYAPCVRCMKKYLTARLTSPLAWMILSRSC